MVVVALLWAIKLAEIAFDWPLITWGILPRQVDVLPGILFAPLLHGSVTHLLANTLPLIILGGSVMIGYPRSQRPALLIIWLVAGVGVWLFGRSSFHIGASGITHGLFFFLLIMGLIRRDRSAIAMLLLVLFLYGGMIVTVLPTQPGVSFESHAFGALGGLLSAFVLRHRDPPQQRRSYDWETEPDADDPRPLNASDIISLIDANEQTRHPRTEHRSSTSQTGNRAQD